MNTITTTASPHASILANDLGKYKSVACVLGDDTGNFVSQRPKPARAELRELIGQEQPAVVVIEACQYFRYSASKIPAARRYPLRAA